MKNIEDKIDDIQQDITEIRIALVKHEANYDKAVNILDRLTSSVEHHIERTDKLQELVQTLKNDQLTIAAKLEKKKSNDQMIWMTLVAVGTIIIGLKELGILDKLL